MTGERVPKILKLRYVGERFRGAHLPLDVLSDLSAYRDLLAAAAKEGWRASHPERQRIPKGFDRSFSFDLTAIEDGSAVPCLQWDRASAQSSLPGFADELEGMLDDAVSSIGVLFDQAEHRSTAVDLPSAYVRALNRLGSTIRIGERIEFLDCRDALGNVVYLDSERRKRLITQSKEAYEVRRAGVGKLIGNLSAGFIRIATDEFGDIDVPVGADDVKSDFDGNLGEDVQFDLQVELYQDDRIKSVTQVFSANVIDGQIALTLAESRAHLVDLSKLQQGWLDGAGQAPSKIAITEAERFLIRRPSVTKISRIYPTEIGGVTIELAVSGWDYSIEFDPSGKVEFYGVEISGSEDMFEDYDSADAEFLRTFDEKVR